MVLNNRFKIIQVNPLEYKKEILVLWKRNLPHTPEERLEWMVNNPDGSPVWYLAIHQETKEVIGSISILPRRIKLAGKRCLGGIVGDFMVMKEYRVFGPAIQLMRVVLRNYTKLGLDFLYTFPNQESEKICLRCGFKKIGVIKRIVIPLNIRNKLIKYMPYILANFFSSCWEILFKLWTFRIHTYRKINFEKIFNIDFRYDLFMELIPKEEGILGERNKEYLKWKYFENPVYKFQMAIYRDSGDGSPLGYIIYTLQENTAHIFDFLAVEQPLYGPIMKDFLKMSSKNRYQGVSLRIIEDNPIFPQIKKLGFFDANEDIQLLYFGDIKISPKLWFFLDGERNI